MTIRVTDLSCGYGPNPVLQDVSLNVPSGQVMSVLGSNGAGKTTLLRTLIGLLPSKTGKIEIDGVDCTTSAATGRYRRNRISWVPEGRGLFAGLSVRDNIDLALQTREQRERAMTMEEIAAILPEVPAWLDRDVASLSGGQQQMVALARAFVSRPRVLLLDEPSLGLAPKIVASIFSTIVEVSPDMAVLLVEQNVELGLAKSHYAAVIGDGRIVLEGQSAELQKRPETLRALLLASQ